MKEDKIIKSYYDPHNNKKLIFTDNINKSGVYRWYNIVTNKSYIGSSIELRKRFYDYLSLNRMENGLLRFNSKIFRSLIKHGYSSFRLDILLYCNKNETFKWEQYYINKLKPEYNILKKAGSSLGFKHSAETIKILKNYIPKPEHLAKLRLAKELSGQIVVILDKNNGYIYKFPSIRAAAKYLDTSHELLIYCMKNKNVTGKRYVVIKLIKINFDLNILYL